MLAGACYKATSLIDFSSYETRKWHSGASGADILHAFLPLLAKDDGGGEPGLLHADTGTFYGDVNR